MAALAGIEKPVRADETAFFVMPEIPYGQRTVGVDLTLGRIDIFRFIGDASLIGLEGAMSWGLSEQLALNGRLGIVRASDDNDDGTSLDNLTIGMTYRLLTDDRGAGTSALAIDASLSLPTASDSDNSGVAALTWGVFYQPDVGRYLPDATTLRVSGTYRLLTGRLMAQAELGLQQLIVDDVDDLTLLRLGMGVGYLAAPRVALIAELTTVSDIIGDNFDNDEDFWHVLDLGARIGLGNGGTLGIRFYLPLDDALRDLDIVGLMLNYQAAL